MSHTIAKAIFLTALCLPAGCVADSAFVPVFIDAATEAKLGAFPMDRAVYANALVALKKLGAKGVVMKFFLDQPKGKGDETLAAAMAGLPVVLQAKCDQGEPTPNGLDAPFSSAAGKQDFSVSCQSGWIPLPTLQRTAADVCFIDQPAPDVVLWHERYQGRAVRTLYACALTLAGNKITHAESSAPLKVDLKKSPPVNAISLVDVLDGNIDRTRITGKVVVLGYEGAKAPTFDTVMGRLSAHRYFMMNLLLLERVQK